jgi:hypothetical protein
MTEWLAVLKAHGIEEGQILRRIDSTFTRESLEHSLWFEAFSKQPRCSPETPIIRTVPQLSSEWFLNSRDILVHLAR